MIRLFSVLFLAVSVLALSGCSFPGASSGSSGAAVVKSSDGGKSYTPKVTVDAKTTIASADVLSFVFESGDSSRITIGTRADGIFVSENGADTWKKLVFPPTKTYGLVSDWSRPERLFATGEWEGRGKLYVSDDRGVKWTEVYAEPNTGTVLTALAQSPRDSSTLFLGTSAGVLLRTDDAGLTWENLPKAEGAVLSFTVDASNETLYALVADKGLARLRDRGRTLDMLPGKSKQSVTKTLPMATSIAVDSRRSGVVYLGTKEGLFRSTDSGESWEELPILESSKKFPIRAIAISPTNSNEIVYSAALALYKSTDGGTSWAVYQAEGNRASGILRYDPSNTNTLYATRRTFGN